MTTPEITTPETLAAALRTFSDRAAADELAADAATIRARKEAIDVDTMISSCRNNSFTTDDVAVVATLVGPCTALLSATDDYRSAATLRRTAADHATAMALTHVELQAAGAAGGFYQGRTEQTGPGTAAADVICPDGPDCSDHKVGACLLSHQPGLVQATPDNLDAILDVRAHNKDEDGDDYPDCVNFDPVNGDDAPEHPRFVDWSDVNYDPADQRRTLSAGNEAGENIELTGIDISDLEILGAALAATILRDEHGGQSFDPTDERAVLLESLRLAGPDDAVHFADGEPDDEDEDFGRYIDWSSRPVRNGARYMEVGKAGWEGESGEAIVIKVTTDDLRRLHAQVCRTILAHRKKTGRK